MPLLPRRRVATGAVRREPKRQRNVVDSWMHLPAAGVSTMRVVQRGWSQANKGVLRASLLTSCAYLLRVAVSTTDTQAAAAFQPLIQLLLMHLALHVEAARFYRSVDRYLFDIPEVELHYPKISLPRQHLRLNTLRDDRTAHRMTGFTVSQLRRLYDKFGVHDFCLVNGDVVLRVHTGHYAPNGTPKCYIFNPEELFLFALTKIRTGKTNLQLVDEFFGGSVYRWSSGYRWIIYYLDDRYKNVVGLQGILRFLPQFPAFRSAMEQYVKRDRKYFDEAGNCTIVPGLNKLPYNICGLIDCTIDPAMVPLSGPAGDYEGAPRKRDFMAAQESIYSGWKHIHGIKMETVYFPNGISCAFGPVSCRRNDRGTLTESGLDAFLELIQQHLPPHLHHMLLGDSIYRGNLRMITTYYRAVPPLVLTPEEIKVNASFRAMRMPIERNYGLNSCVQRLLDTRRANYMGRRHPYALEQLRVCQLLLNCYICLNGDQGGHVNTFACTPPTLEEYLTL